jgi:uncharacterized membrane protein (GlpM family)
MLALDLLLIHIVLAFSSGWLVVAAVTTIADVYGTGRAGFVGGLPSTGAVSLLFIGWYQSQDAAIQATAVFPLAFSVTFAFLMFYAFPERMRFGPRIATALLIWLLLSTLVAVSGFDDFYVALATSIIISSTVFFVHRRIGIRDAPTTQTKLSLATVLWRGALGGFVVTGVVLLSSVGGPLVGGVFAAAPAIWASSLYVTSRTHGVEFSRSLTKSFMLTGILTVIPYSIAARYLFPEVGVWWGTFYAYVTISPAAWLAWVMTRKKEGVTSHGKNLTDASATIGSLEPFPGNTTPIQECGRFCSPLAPPRVRGSTGCSR